MLAALRLVRSLCVKDMDTILMIEGKIPRVENYYNSENEDVTAEPDELDEVEFGLQEYPMLDT